MLLFLYILIFLASCFLLFYSSTWLIDSLSKIAKFLEWKEFVVAIFLVAFSVSLPNFFVGIISAVNKVPDLSLGDVVGGNVVALTFMTGIAALISKRGLSAPSRTVQQSSLFTIFTSILVLLLVLDGVLSRADAVILLLVFIGYVAWLFKKKERFVKIYNSISEPIGIKFFFKNLGIFLGSITFLLFAAFLMVKSACFFASHFSFNLCFIGIIVLGLSNNLGELAFIFQAAKKSKDWFVLGDLIGGVIVTNTLILAIVALIHPIVVSDLLSFSIARIFLLIAAIFFFFFLRSGQKITKKEGIFLLGIYALFIISEILIK